MTTMMMSDGSCQCGDQPASLSLRFILSPSAVYFRLHSKKKKKKKDQGGKKIYGVSGR